VRVTNRLFAPVAGLLFLIGAAPLQATPRIQTWETPEGVPVLFVAAPDLPMLDVRIAFQAGSARDGDQPGLAALTADLLDQGAGDWDANAIAERLEAVGAEMSIDAQRDMASASLRSLTRQPALNQALETLTLVISQPRFRESDFERMRANVLTSLSRDEQDPGTLGQKAIYRRIFVDHPYATDPSGTPESVAALSREDLARFHARHYVARNAVIALVGAVTRPEAEAIAAQLTAGLAKGEPMPPLPPVQDPPTAVLEHIAFPSTQTHVYTGQPGMSRGDPDYFTLYVGNHILGGSGLVSLLMEEVREKRGLSYSVSSYFLPLAERGPFVAALSTKNEQGQSAREVLMTTIERFRTQGPTPEELTAAIKNITGGFPLRIAGNGKIAQYLAMIGFYGLPLDYLDRFNDRISAVTAEGIRDAFQRRIDPARFATVIVGPEMTALDLPQP
jgi:zinc protease